MSDRWGGDPEPLNQAQQRVLDRLGARPDDRRTFDEGLARELRTEIEDGLADAVGRAPGERLVLAKGVLEGIHGCEARFVSADAFRWTAASAKGAVAHKAIEVWITRPTERVPLDLVDEAIARFQADEWGVGEFLARAPEAVVDEVRALANTYLAKFLETWPPLSRKWWPVTETSIRVELLGDALVLSGRPDLTLGRASGSRAGKVIVDFKTGGHAPTHRADLRFYALLDVLKVGTPPRLLATSYLDSGRLEVEVVDEDLLFAEVRRVVDAGHRLVALQADGAEPRRSPGPPCRWCTLRADCGPGRAYLAEGDDPEVLDDLDALEG